MLWPKNISNKEHNPPSSGGMRSSRKLATKSQWGRGGGIITIMSDCKQQFQYSTKHSSSPAEAFTEVPDEFQRTCIEFLKMDCLHRPGIPWLYVSPATTRILPQITFDFNWVLICCSCTCSQLFIMVQLQLSYYTVASGFYIRFWVFIEAMNHLMKRSTMKHSSGRST